MTCVKITVLVLLSIRAPRSPNIFLLACEITSISSVDSLASITLSRIDITPLSEYNEFLIN